MTHRIQSRRADGRWQQATLQNTFGLDVLVRANPECRQLNPWKVGVEPRPVTCHACGMPMRRRMMRKANGNAPAAGTLYRVVLPYSVAGVIADEAGIVRHAAPILRWAIGRPVAALARWATGKGGTVTRLGNDKGESR